MKYGPETPTVEAFIRHLKGMTKEEWAEVDAAVYAMDAMDVTARLLSWLMAWRAAEDAVGKIARDAAGHAASLGAVGRYVETLSAMTINARVWEAAGHATYEILGEAIMRKHGEPFYFLPMFGFESPEAVLENDQ